MGKTKKHVKTFEFLSVFCTAVGITIGIGIYLKNDTSPGHVMYFTQNPFLAIGLWLLVGILGIAMIMVFIEIASSKTKSGHGTLAAWANIFLGRKVGSLYAIFYIFFYFPIMLGIFSIFSVDAMFAALRITSISVDIKNFICVIIGMTFLILISLQNIYLRNVGKWVQTIGTFVKFVPLLVSLIIGFIIPMNGNVFDTFKELKLGNLFMGLLPVLFAFDGFIYAASLQKEIINKNVVPKALFVAMLFISIFYILEVISLFFGTNDGSVFSLFDNAIGGPIAQILQWFIVITALMSINGMSLVAPNIGHSGQDEKLLYIGKKEFNHKIIGLIQMGITIVIVLTIVGISLGYKSDPMYMLDTTSNVITLIAFFCYLAMVIVACVNRRTKRVEISKVKGMYYYAGFSIFVLLGSTGFIFYSFFANSENNDLLFSFLIIVALVLIIWGINEYFLKKYSDQNGTKDPLVLKSNVVVVSSTNFNQ